MQSFGAAKNVTLCQPARQMPGCSRLAASLAELGARRNFANYWHQSTPGVGPGPHAKFRSCAKCHTMLTGPIANKPSLARVATLQTNGTKALPGSVRVHMQSFGAAQNVTLC